MATLTVRNLDDEVAHRLRVRAAEHGRSTEAEHREILRIAVSEATPLSAQHEAARRLAAFRLRTAGRGSATGAALLAESRRDRSGTEP